jgi:hypothetical protein
MARVSLCMIARDEEQLLPGCLASVAGAVDEIVLADTGSRDRTPALAREAGAVVVHEPWQGDFARARNAALRRARGDFVLVLDADERLAPGAAASLRAAVRGASWDVGLLPLHNAARLDAAPEAVVAGACRLGPPMRLPRLLRNAGGLAFRGIVHESIEEWAVRRGGAAALVHADIVHLGAVPELRAARGKQGRNLELLRRRCADDAADAAAHGYLAGELYELGRLDEAATAAERGWATFAAQPPARSLHRLAVVRALVALRQGDAARALESVARAEARQGPHDDLAWLRGCALELLAGRSVAAGSAPPCAAEGARAASAYAGAAEAFLAAERLRREPRLERLTEAALPGAALTRAAEALLDARRPGDARALFESALSEAPGSCRARAGLAEAALDAGDPGAALSLVEPALREGADGFVVAAAAAQAVGADADARALLAGARARLALGLARPRRAARLDALARALDAA